MRFLNSQARTRLQKQLTDFFPRPDVYYIHSSSAAASERQFHDYYHAITAAIGKKHLGLIAFPETGLVPYLSVRSNILINQRSAPRLRWLQNWPLALDCLDANVETLSVSQAVYVQFYRGLVAGQSILLMRDFPPAMPPLAIRQFIAHAQHAVQLTETKLLILTTDTTLIAAHPESSWQTPPRFSGETA